MPTSYSYDSYTLRPLRAEDEAILEEMMYLAIFVPEGQAPPPRDIVQVPNLSKYYRLFGRAGDIGFLAVDNATQEPLGAAWVRLTHGYGYVDDDTPELTMAVVPLARGQGIGTELLTRLIEVARSHYSGISLSVWPDNAAYRLYQRLGFQVVKTNEGEDVIMLKRFAPLGQPINFPTDSYIL